MKIQKELWHGSYSHKLCVVGVNQGSNKPKMVIVMGSRIQVEGLDNYNFFIHNSIFHLGYSVTELTTGLSVYHGTAGVSEEKVTTEAAKLLIGKFKSGELQAAIMKAKEIIEKGKEISFPVNEIIE